MATQTITTKALANIGDGATIQGWSDRSAGTVIAATKTTVTIQMDTATPAEGYEYYGNQVHDFAANPQGLVRVFSVRKNGQLVVKGSPLGRGCTTAFIGSRNQYRDPSF